ncbi:Helix-turn-helix domain protein [Legionella gratiana]|uniref:Helix-turn-helix domain n=1 Tax=Legionella gratiana TaxID=45066 RepID=A0A378JHR6_9GAMM|nr:helix-turn-helix transcriptional regulator [Legionella gratiana]KTD14770.1 Helix-turn-helix domain protein [Legionella gratiana]STX44220.1 Helix-turn-helix domain [Legionella gratiana]
MVSSPLPKRLKEARLASQLSQKELGIAAGIDRFSASPRINQYETGKHTPDFLTLKKLAEVLLLPTAFFYAEEDELAEIIKAFKHS